MGRLLKLCNFYSFMGIWCTQEFYRKMSQKGFRLTETSLFLDTYEKSKGAELWFTLIPKEFEPADNDAIAKNSWKFLGQNRNFYAFYYIFVTVQRAGKLVQKRVLSWLIRPILHQFSHRMDIRCFLTGFSVKKMPPSEQLQILILKQNPTIL